MNVTEEKPRRKSTGCLWVVIAFQAISLLAAGGIIIALIAAGLTTLPRRYSHQGMGADDNPQFREIWSSGSGKTKVVRIPLYGMIMMEDSGGFFPPGPGSTSMALQSIARATADPNVRAIILEVDSGGGGITASDILYTALQKFKSSADGRKVVALYGDVAASGAYYVSVAADHIVAHPTTITGSIGVLMQTFNVQGLAEKLGVKDVTIKSAPNKDILNPFQELTEDQRAMLQEVIDEMYDRFVGLVATNRNLTMDEVKRVADGRIFTAGKAKEYGLVDQIGYWGDTVTKTAELLGVNEISVYRYEQAISFASFLRARAPTETPEAVLRRLTQLRLLYRWQP
jgi:protease-4